MTAPATALLSVLLGMTVALAWPAEVVGQEEGQETAIVTVQNRANSPIHVYALQGGHMVALGFVAGLASEELRLPEPLAQADEPVALVADWLDTTDWHITDAVDVGPMDRLRFTVEADPDRSMVSATG